MARRSSAVHYNPGQLGFINQTELELGAGLIFGSIGYQRERRGQYQFADEFNFAEPIDPADIDPSRTGSAEAVRATPLGPAVDAFAAIPVVSDRLTLGLGFYVPYAALLSLPLDGAQRFQAQSVTLVSTHTTVSAGVKLHDVISLGAGVSYVLSIMQLSKVQDFAAVPAFADGLAAPPINQDNSLGPNAPSTVRELDLLARQADIGPTWSHGVSFNVGAAIRPTDKLDLALVYQHGSRVRLRGDFTLDMDDDFFTQDLAATGLQFDPIVQGEANIELSLPKRLTVGAGYRLTPKLSLDGSVSYVFYSDFDVIDIELSSPQLAQPALGIGSTVPQELVRDWNNTVHAQLNLRGQATDKLLLSGTLGYQSGASPDSTVDMASPDGHRLIGGVGLEYGINERWSVLGDLYLQGIVPRTVTESDFDLGNGTYRMFLGVAAFHARIKLGKPGERKQRSAEPASEPASEPADESTPTEEIPADEAQPADEPEPAPTPSGEEPASIEPTPGSIESAATAEPPPPPALDRPKP
ncbi:MAG: outer membrane protein transport protein [Myxococcota bacterium]